jgi:hypothetical protein
LSKTKDKREFLHSKRHKFSSWETALGIVGAILFIRAIIKLLEKLFYTIWNFSEEILSDDNKSKSHFYDRPDDSKSESHFYDSPDDNKSESHFYDRPDDSKYESNYYKNTPYEESPLKPTE